MNETYPNISERRAAFFGHSANRVAATGDGRWRGKPAREPSTCELARESRRAVASCRIASSSRVTGTYPCVRTVCNCHSPRSAHTLRVYHRDISGRSPFPLWKMRRIERGRGRGWRIGETFSGRRKERERENEIFARRCLSATEHAGTGDLLAVLLASRACLVVSGSIRELRDTCSRCRCDSRSREDYGTSVMQSGTRASCELSRIDSAAAFSRTIRDEKKYRIRTVQWPADHRAATRFLASSFPRAREESLDAASR